MSVEMLHSHRRRLTYKCFAPMVAVTLFAAPLTNRAPTIGVPRRLKQRTPGALPVAQLPICHDLVTVPLVELGRVSKRTGKFIRFSMKPEAVRARRLAYAVKTNLRALPVQWVTDDAIAGFVDALTENTPALGDATAKQINDLAGAEMRRLFEDKYGGSKT